MEPGIIEGGGSPISHSGGGSFFSQDLGTVLRLSYNTESYGQNDHGNFDIGTMQVVSFDDSILFVDGQVTLNDVQGVGFNIGVGYRWLSIAPYALESERISGVSLWVDGTSTRAGNFFPQIGLSFESLGEMWDLRANGYIPVGGQDKLGRFEPIGETGFQGNFLSQLTQATVDSSLYVGEVELARRLGAQRDAWAFAGPYFLANSDVDTAGFRAGVRGYAYPDLLLQFGVSNDELFDTTATFSMIWFVGRTRTDFQPACGLPDRFREPVLRNDYVALTQDRAIGGIALTAPDGSPLRIVHVDSNAAPGGDGTFENPLNNLNNVNNFSQAGDLVLAHAESEFVGQMAMLRNRQRFLGEGDGFNHTITTLERGTISLPETSDGARELARPMILDAIGDAVTLADLNEVANFDIDGGVRGIGFAPGVGAGSPNLHNLSISNTTGDGIALTPFVRVDTAANTRTVAFNVTIRDVDFDNIGGDDIDIDAFTTENLNSSNVILQEAINIRNVTSTNGAGRGAIIQNTHGPGTVTVMDYRNGIDGTAGSGSAAGGIHFLDIAGDVTFTNVDVFNNGGFAFDFTNAATTTAVSISGTEYDGGAGVAGGMRFDNFDGTLSAMTSTLENGTLAGVSIVNGSSGTFNFASTVTFDSIEGTAFEVNGFTGGLSVAGDITNDTGRSVTVQNVSTNSANVTFTGDITDTGTGILVSDNTDGLILFAGDIDLDTDTDSAITLTNNTGADLSFAGMLDIDTTSGNAFVATGGGNLSVTNTTNSITTETGRIAQITGMTISGAGVNFSEVNRTMAAATEAILLDSNTGGPILFGTVGDNPGESGTIVGGPVDAIIINNSANVTVSGLQIDNSANVSGVRVTKSNAGTQTVNLNDLEINGGDIGVEVIGGGSGNLNMTVNDTTINNPSNLGLSFDNVDNGTIQVNNTTVDGNNLTAVAGVQISDSDATFTLNSTTAIREVNGVAFDVDGGAPNINMAGSINNTLGDSVRIRNTTGGVVTMTGAVTDTGAGSTGVTIADNTGGDINLLGTYALTTSTNDAVEITNNTGADVSLSGLTITTTSGRGLVATGGGDLTVTGATNTITTTTGTGLEIDGMNIIGQANFQSVTVNGATNAIVLNDVTGAPVTVGSAVGAANSGGTLNTTGDAISLTNVENVVLNNVRIQSAGGDGVTASHTAASDNNMSVTIRNMNLVSATGTGISASAAKNDTALDFALRLLGGNIESNVDIDVTGSADFLLLADSTDIDTSGTNDVAFELTFSGSARNGDVTIRNGSNFEAGTESALFIDTTGANSKTIRLLVEDSMFSNSSATDATSDIFSRGNTLFNATIRGNTFANSNAGGSDFDMTADGAQARMRLNLGGDDAAEFNTAAGVGEFNLIEVANGADFDVFQRDDTFNDLRNNGSVVTTPNDAAFDDLLVAPPLPTVP